MGKHDCEECRVIGMVMFDLPGEGAVEPVQKKTLRGQVSGGGILRMPKAGAGAPLDLQDERSKGGHPLQLGRGVVAPWEGWTTHTSLGSCGMYLIESPWILIRVTIKLKMKPT